MRGIRIVELNPEFGIEIRTDPIPMSKPLFTLHGRMVRVHAFLSKEDADIVAQPLGVEDLEIPVRGKVARAAVNNPAIKGNTVPGRHIPTQDLVILSMAFDIGERFVILVPIWTLVAGILRQGAEVGLLKFLRPAM